MFKFFIINELISTYHLRFKPGNSYINQLLAITHKVYKSFDDGFEVRSVFLDVSKAFYKVWYEGLIFKLKRNSISGNLLNLLCNFLRKILKIKHMKSFSVRNLEQYRILY